MCCIENEYYPEFVQQHATVTVSASLRRGDAVAQLEASDADFTTTCQGGDCPCARQAFAIESGNTEGLFAVDGSTGLVSAASDLAGHDGQVFKLYVSVVNQGVDMRSGSDVRGPKNFGSLTVVIGQVIGELAQQSAASGADDVDESVHIRHKRASHFTPASALFLPFRLLRTKYKYAKYVYQAYIQQVNNV